MVKKIFMAAMMMLATLSINAQNEAVTNQSVIDLLKGDSPQRKSRVP